MLNTAPYNDSRRVVYPDAQTMSGRATAAVTELRKRGDSASALSSAAMSVTQTRRAVPGVSIRATGTLGMTGATIRANGVTFASVAAVYLNGNYHMRQGGFTANGTAIVTQRGDIRHWSGQPLPDSSWKPATGVLDSIWKDTNAHSSNWKKVGIGG